MRMGFFSADSAGALKPRIIVKKITGTIKTMDTLFMGPLLPLIQKFKAVQRVSPLPIYFSHLLSFYWARILRPLNDFPPAWPL
jgi:hypothetical protein